jgi:hypothetical protein
LDTPTVTVPQPGSPAPRKGFGEIVTSALGGVARGATGVLSVLSPPAGLVAGIVSGVASAVGAIAGGGGASPIQSDADVLALLSKPGELSSQDYLRIQHYMQTEAQQFTAVSNILKVRSDSAKAAINNIR